jgi:selenide,water dikinase
MGPEALAQVLRPLTEIFCEDDHPDLLVGLEHADDAAVYRLSDELAMIQTVDFFPPIVEDPYAFGAIAAANALSDIYAMGGEPFLALNVAAFPPDLPADYLAEIVRGSSEKVKEAGGIVAGGHTIMDAVPKFGLCVTGFVHPDRIWTKEGTRPGDALVLTKPLGTGVILTADKRRRADAAHVAAAVEQMARLNRRAAEIFRSLGNSVHAVTDITGFALLGHGLEMVAGSGTCLRFEFARLPFVAGAAAYAEQGLHCSATERNEAYYSHHVRFGSGLHGKRGRLLYGSESSGGLLAAVDRKSWPALEAALRDAGQPYWLVGEAVAGEGIEVW